MLILAVLLALARVWYLAHACPYTLAEDEAFYWTWSKRPELSYYSKGPGVAWAIWTSIRYLGDTELGVRLPAVIFSSLTMLAIGGLTFDVTGSRRAGMMAALCFALAPMFQVLGLTMTIDGPYAFCWTVACWAGWRGLAQKSGPALAMCGVMIGLGFTFKYTILLLLPGLIVFFLLRRREQRLPPVTVLWLIVALAGVVAGMWPVVEWNRREGWPTLAHLLGHLGVEGGDKAASQGVSGWHYDPTWTLGFIGSQVAAMGPALVLSVLALVRDRREGADETRRRATLFLLCTGLPPLAFYLLVSLATPPKVNWALAGFLPLLALAGREVVEAMDRLRAAAGPARLARWSRALWFAAWVVGLAFALATIRLDLVSRGLEWLRAQPALAKLIPAKAYIPMGRISGAREMGVHAGEIVADLRTQTGREPFVMAQHYGRSAQLEFYMPGNPLVLCASGYVDGGRRTQYDYWAQTDLRRRDDLIGRDALLVGGWSTADWKPYFRGVELLGRLDGDGKPDRPAFIGRGFKGMGELHATPPDRNPSDHPGTYPPAPHPIPDGKGE